MLEIGFSFLIRLYAPSLHREVVHAAARTPYLRSVLGAVILALCANRSDDLIKYRHLPLLPRLPFHPPVDLSAHDFDLNSVRWADSRASKGSLESKQGRERG